MINVVFSWIYVLIFMYLSGNAYLRLQNRLVPDERESDFFEIIFSGIMITTLFAQVFSIFYKLGVLANIILAVLLLLYMVCDRRYLISRIKNVARPTGLYLIATTAASVATIVFALCASGPVRLIDTDWYHAQNIRWIEEYGCVKGLANLFYALGFNSPQHYFDALFSQKFIFGQSMRFSGGLFGLLIFLHGIYRIAGWKKHSKHIADVIAAGEVVYSVIITAFYADPYTDTLPNILILFIVTEWFVILESGQENISKMARLCVLGVFATAVKSSAAMVVLLTIQPAYYLIRDKKWKAIIICILEGILILIPYAVTNIITTGYPVYLLTSVKLPGCKWMIDPSVLKYATDDMIRFARMPEAELGDVLHCGLRWVPGWFRGESVSHQILYIVLAAMIVYDIIATIIEWLKNKCRPGWEVLPRICIYAGLVYWFMTIPQVKYCWSYLIIPICVVPMCHSINKYVTGLVRLSAIGVAVLYLGFYSLRTLGYIREGHIFRQEDYLVYDFELTQINGIDFYIKKDDGDIACGYHIFPYYDNKERIQELVVGDTIKDGFYYLENK